MSKKKNINNLAKKKVVLTLYASFFQIKDADKLTAFELRDKLSHHTGNMTCREYVKEKELTFQFIQHCKHVWGATDRQITRHWGKEYADDLYTLELCGGKNGEIQENR